jgi:hypothetical protein
MFRIKRWLRRLRRLWSLLDDGPREDFGQLQIEALVRAHGDWLALLATILERERVITGAELARSLSEFATLTAEDRPAEGKILSFWASRLQDTAASIREFPSLH